MSIQSEIDRLNAAKADIQSALVEGGQTVEPTDTLTDYAGKVRALSSGFAEQIAYHNEDSEAHPDIRAAIPTKTSDLTNDEGFITNIVDSDLEVSGTLRVTDHAVFQNGATVAGSLITPGGEELYLHSGNISDYAISNGGGQVSGNYTLEGNLTLGELYADILNLGSDEDGVYAGVYRHNNVINLEIFGRENDDPVRLNGIETPISDYGAANKLYVDSTKLIVTASFSQAGGFYERSHTNEEIVAAVQEGRNVRIDVHFEDDEEGHTYHLSDFFKDGSCCFSWTNGYDTLSYITVYSDDTVWELEGNILTAGSIGAAPIHRYSTTDLTAGVSVLANGQLYVVYE